MKYRLLALFILCGSFGVNVCAATISKIKNDKALISLDGTDANVGDSFYGMDSAGKKRSIVRVTAVKNGKAIAQIVKGKAEEGQTLEPYKGAAVGATAGAARGKSALSHFGILVSYLINKMSANFTFNSTAQTANMTGNGFGALGYYDYGLTPTIQIRGSAGIEQFQVSETHATSACDKGSTTTCNAIINYLSGYGLAKYNFINGPTKAWVGAGGGYLYAITKSSTVLDSSQITANYVLSVSAGMDINMSRGQYIPIVLEYSLFPSSSTVTASFIALRAGWGWR